MTPETPYKVAVRDLPAHRRIEISPAFVAETVKGMPMRDALESEDAAAGDGGTAEIELNEDGTNVYVQGSISGRVTVACSRCVGPCTIPLEERVRVTFVPAADLPAEKDDDEDLDVESDELDVFPYDGEHVDLEPLLREHWVLAVPFAPLCRDDCAGLCAQCGADRNVSPCDCEKPIDPRFGPLVGLKLPT